MSARKTTFDSPSTPARRRARVWLVVPVGVAGLLVGAVLLDWWTCLPPGAQATYVGRQSCAQCHSQQVHAWTGSDHNLAMQLATAETVLGDFNDAEFTLHGVTSRMFQRRGDFFVHTEGADGQMGDFQVKYTFGVRPLQQYMVEFPDGRVQVLRISWDTERKQWFNVPPPDVDDRILPGDPLHWTGTAQNWNHMCADCHSTNVQKNYDLETDTYKTTFSEIDVSCEACHGPGSLHVELAESKSLFWDRKLGYGLAKLKGPSSKNELETCAKCHARRNIVHPDFRAGSELLDHYEPALLHEGLYHADGQILDEVYEYGSFVQSKMYHKNVRCTDCHDPHTTRLKFEGNRLCSQCHEPGKYDTPAHHHHAPGSKGASCVECHMPATTYMVVDPRRDHSFRIPRPDLSAQLGTPNACNTCHDKPHETASWAAAQIVSWYGPNRPDDPHYAVALAAARERKPEAEQLLIKCVGRPNTPAIARATAIELLGEYISEESRKARERALGDPSPLVRAAAARSIAPPEVSKMKQDLLPLTSDPVRAVRAAAARRLVGISLRSLDDDQYAAFDSALEEYRQGQLANSDRAGAHLNLGNLYQELGRSEQAIAAFETAIRVEPYLAGPRSNLAVLLEQLQRDEAQVQRLRSEEVDLLARDASLLPDNVDVLHRYGLALYLVGKLEEAEKVLARVCQLEPQSARFRMELTLLYERLEDWDKALESLQVLEELMPGNPSVRLLRDRFRAAARSGP